MVAESICLYIRTKVGMTGSGLSNHSYIVVLLLGGPVAVAFIIWFMPPSMMIPILSTDIVSVKVFKIKHTLSHLQADSTWEITRHLSWPLFSMTGPLDPTHFAPPSHPKENMTCRWKWPYFQVCKRPFKSRERMLQVSKVLDIHTNSSYWFTLYTRLKVIVGYRNSLSAPLLVDLLVHYIHIDYWFTANLGRWSLPPKKN